MCECLSHSFKKPEASFLMVTMGDAVRSLNGIASGCKTVLEKVYTCLVKIIMVVLHIHIIFFKYYFWYYYCRIILILQYNFLFFLGGGSLCLILGIIIIYIFNLNVFIAQYHNIVKEHIHMHKKGGDNILFNNITWCIFVMSFILDLTILLLFPPSLTIL